MKKSILVAILFVSHFAISQEAPKILVINPEGHRGAINAIEVDKSGNIITAGNDKIIKIWNSKEATLEREIHGQIGPGSEGKIYTLALSTDNKYLAASGWFNKDNSKSDLGIIRIYDYKTGKLIRLLNWHDNTLKATHFLPNTHELYSLDYFGNLVRWNLDDKSQTNLTTVEKDVVNFEIHSEFIVTAHKSGHVHLWDINNMDKPAATYNTFQKGTAEDMCLAIAPDGQQIVVSTHYHLYILNRKMKLKYTLDQGEDYIIRICFSPNSERMVVVSGSNQIEKQIVRAYEKREETWYYMSVFTRHTMSADCAEFITNDKCVTADKSIAIWKPEKTKEKSTLIHWIESDGNFFTSVGMNDDKIAFGTVFKERYGFSRFQSVFDLTNRIVRPYSETDSCAFPQVAYKNYTTEISTSQSNLIVRDGKTVLSTIARESGNGTTHIVVTLIKNDFVVSGGGNGVLEVFYLDGKMASELVGHESDISGLSISSDGKYLVSSAWDQTIRLWKIDEFGKSNVIYPTLSLFIAKDNEWVLWNQEGYFTSSKKGASYIGFHINQGQDKVAKYYPFEQFDLKYNRPDIIMESLGFVDSAIIDLYHSAYLKRLKRMGIGEADLSAEMNVPLVQIHNSPVSDQKISLTISAQDSLFELKTLNVFINEVPVFGRKGIELTSKKIEQTISLDLMAGVNKIQVSVTNAAGVESLKERVIVKNDVASESNLFIISLGVSTYQNQAYNLDYAAKDAEDVKALFATNSHFKNVYQKMLLNKDVTRENIILLKDFLAQANRNDVVLFFIAGHGVLNKNLDYYYCTYNMDFLAPEKFGITYAELEVLFDGIKAIRKLLIMDTCHSGEVDKDDVEEIAFVNSENPDITFRNTNTTTTIRETQGLQKTNEAVKEMFNDLRTGTGATVISSAGGAEYAMESDEWRNGLFTYCLLEGITTKNADVDKNGEIMLSELQNYISTKVAELSNGRQMPTSRFENLNLDYRIW